MSRIHALLTAALIASVLGQWVGATTADRRLNLAYAGLAALALIAAAIVGNVKAWRESASARGGVAAARHGIAQMNARFLGAAYAWGAASMLTVYHLTGLKWQHGWQYGLGMALIALGLFLYARQLAVEGAQNGGPPLHAWTARATALHAVALTFGLMWLVFSGKLDTQKADWAANAIFVFGGIALVVLSDIAVAVQARLGGR